MRMVYLIRLQRAYAMYFFYHLPPDLLWFMVGSATGLSFEVIPSHIGGFSRLKWPQVVLFLPARSLKHYGEFALNDYDVLFQMVGMLYAEIASENGQILAISDYSMLSRMLRALVMNRGFVVTDVSERHMRLVSPSRRRSRRLSLINMCCGIVDREVDTMTVAMAMQCMGAEASGNRSPVSCVKAAGT